MEIDFKLGQKILDAVNASESRGTRMLEVDVLPCPDGKDIFALNKEIKFTIERAETEHILSDFEIPLTVLSKVPKDGNTLTFNFENLTLLGLHLIPYLSYGVLNGGMATSYGDVTNNSKFNAELFKDAQTQFDKLCTSAKDKPKGITPAFINPDGTSGFDFLELKMRSVLLYILKSQSVTGKGKEEYQHSMFQMTSHNTDSKLWEKYKEYKNSPILKELIDKTGVDITEPESAIQPLIPTFTHTQNGYPLSFFKKKDGTIYALPGGHGQNFFVLKDVYKKLLGKGKRFVYLGNVDNIGFTVSPVELAVLALSGRRASFDFSFKTPVDVKGGILVREKSGKLNCGDIGRAVSKEFVKASENAGTPILFNCATGLFDLKYLVENIDRIIDSLPVRISNQNKDVGMYSQAEQITWEVIGLLDNLIIFAVNKNERFIASKLLIENMITSGLECCENYLNAHKDSDFAMASRALQTGLKHCLETQYGLKLEDGRWKTK